MIVRAALAALACLAARVAGQAKVCDTMDESGNAIEVAFTKIPIDKDVDLPCAILAADIDGDGDVDVFTALEGNEEFRWYENKGKPSEGNVTMVQKTVAGTFTKPTAIHAADIDGDGDVDLLLSYGSSANNGVTSWFENDGSATTRFTNNAEEHAIVDVNVYSSLLTTAFAMNGYKTHMVHGEDVDGDGDADVLAANEGANSVFLLFNGCAGTAESGSGCDSGNSDYVGGGPFLGTSDYTAGSTSFVKLNVDTSEPIEEPQSVFPADYDGDGDIDVLVAATDTDANIVLYENDGTSAPMTFTQHVVATTLTDARYVMAVDLLEDGADSGTLYLDLLVASNNDGYIAWFENSNTTGKSLPDDCNEVLLTKSGDLETNNDNARGATSVRAADFNGDGCLDIVYAGTNLAGGGATYKIVWEENRCGDNPGLDITSTKHFMSGLGDPVSGSPAYRVEVGDLDDDGDVDAGARIKISSYLRALPPRNCFGLTRRWMCTQVDALLASYTQTWISWFENDCAAPPTPAPTADVPTSVPTGIPTSYPSAVPIPEPTGRPTVPPTALPTGVPTTLPSPVPTVPPTAVPTGAPTSEPTGRPTVPPTALPTGVPTTLPSSVPTVPPTPIPAPIPTPAPTPRPSVRCSAGVTFSTEHDVEASGRYLNVHVVDGAKIKVARRLPRPSARRRGTG